MVQSDSVANASRRAALKRIAMGTGAMTTFPILGQGVTAPGMAHGEDGSAGATQANLLSDANWKPIFFDEHQNETVIALTELIIPATDTPGAKAALVNRFIDLWLNEEAADRQKDFIHGLAWIDGRSLKLHGKPFTELATAEQTTLLAPLADPDNKNPEDQPGVRFFEHLKDTTIFGYYTSQVGLQQELQYGGGDYHTEFPGACTHPEHQS